MDDESQAAAKRLRMATKVVLAVVRFRRGRCEDNDATLASDVDASREIRSASLAPASLSPQSLALIGECLLNDYVEIRVWFFKCAEYLAWLDGKPWYLCCYAEPRCGKTRESSFAAAVAENIRAGVSGQTAAVVTLFLGHVDVAALTPAAILQSIWLQLRENDGVEGARGATSAVVSVHGADCSGPSIPLLRMSIAEEIGRLNKVFLVVDGLESITEESTYQSVEHELAALLKSDLPSHQPLRLLLVQARSDIEPPTFMRCDAKGDDCSGGDERVYWQCDQCRDPLFQVCYPCYEQGHRTCLQGRSDSSHVLREPYKAVHVHLETPALELSKYVNSRLRDVIGGSSLRRRIRSQDELASNLRSIVIQKAAGVFAIAKTYLDSLVAHPSLDEAFETLDRLPPDERRFFRSLVKDIASQVDEQDRKLAVAALALVAVSCHEAREGLALTFDEFVEAVLALTQLRHTNLSPSRFLRITKGFLTVNKANRQTVRAFHEDANTYLADECNDVFASLQLDMARLCIDTILCACEDISLIPQDISSLMAFLDRRPFVSYCIRHWGNYISSDSSIEVLDAASELLVRYQSEPRLRQLMFLAINNNESQGLWSGTDVLHVLAWFGLSTVYAYFESHHRTLRPQVFDAGTGRTPLHLALIRGNIDFAEKLMQNGADPSAPDHQGRTCLWLLVEQNDYRILQALLAGSCARGFCAAVNVRNVKADGQTIMMLAVRKRLYDMIRLLLPLEELDLDVTDSSDRTALHIASGLCDATALQLLTTTPCPAVSRAHLNIPERLGRTACMMLLATLYSEFSPCGPDPEPLPFLEKCLQQDGSTVDQRDANGRTILHYACVNEEGTSVVKELLQHGAGVNHKDDSGRTALHVAATIDQDSTPQVVSLPKGSGANLLATDRQHLTPYNVAARLEATWADELKWERHEPEPDREHAQPTFQIFWDKMTLQEDNTHQHIRDLASLKADEIRQQDPLGNGLLHFAVRSRDVKLLRLLLQDGRIDVNARNLSGRTALHIALFQLGEEPDDDPAFVEMIRLLVRHNADLESPDHQCFSPVQLALHRDRNDMVMEFIAAGAGVKLLRNETQYLLKHAIRNDRPEVVGKLLAAGASLFLYCRATRLPSQTAAEEHASERMQERLREWEHETLVRIAG